MTVVILKYPNNRMPSICNSINTMNSCYVLWRQKTGFSGWNIQCFETGCPCKQKSASLKVKTYASSLENMSFRNEIQLQTAFLFIVQLQSNSPGNCGIPMYPEIRKEQAMSRPDVFILWSECGWCVTLDKMPLWEAVEGCLQRCHSCKRIRSEASN